MWKLSVKKDISTKNKNSKGNISYKNNFSEINPDIGIDVQKWQKLINIALSVYKADFP